MDYTTGQEAFYHEDGSIFKVKVLKADCDEKWERYTLKVLDILQENPMFVPPKIGEEFNCDKQRGVACGGLWSIINH